MNIIFFICHDLGRELGCYGARIATPNLDRFAREGVVFDNAFCNSPCCSPSRGCTVNGAQRRHVYRPMPEQDVYVPPCLPAAPVIRRELAGFCGAANYLDSQFQRFLDVADRFGFRDKMLVVFTTDHGISGERVKGWIYDAGVATALLMRLPRGAGAGARHKQLIQNIDLAPTLLEAAGITPPARMQGRSFWSLLTGGSYAPHEAIFIERNDHDAIMQMRAARAKKFNYIRNCGENLHAPWPPSPLPQPPEGLYDTESDPLELDNPEYGRVKAELAARLDRWMNATNDPVPSGQIARPV